jgi:hypothetical protein
MRDEGLLKLFFAESAGGDSAAATLEAKRRHHAQIVEHLTALEASGRPEGYAHLVLRYGIEFNQWIADWCEETKRSLEHGAASERRTA